MKRSSVIMIAILLILASCAPSYDKKEEVVEKTNDETQEETAIVPSYNISEQNYKMILPYKPSKSRGVIVNQISNRLDINELEEGLRRHSKDVYSPENYYFQEGQYLTEDMVYSWLGRTMTDDQVDDYIEEEVDTDKKTEKEIEQIKKDLKAGLNPPIKDDASKKDHENSPKYLSHILEQDYLVQKEGNTVQLGGISIGIALKSVYRYQTETGGPYYYEEIPLHEMLKKGKKIADQVLQKVRGIEEIKNVPIMIALYREEEQGSLVPGNFIAKAKVKGGKSSVSEWESVEEEYILFPSDEGEEKYTEDAKNIEELQRQITEYFPNYVGIIGKGFYVDKELKDLTITIPIQFHGKAEVIGFTQYVYGLVKEIFKNYFDIEVNIKSSNRQESLITREAGEDDPSVHVYD